MAVRSWILQEEINLPRRYRPMEPIGQGAFGLVFSALDSARPSTNCFVAIKKTRVSGNSCARHILQEITVLRQICHDNVLGLDDIIHPCGGSEDLYLVTELMETDLGSVLKSDQVLEEFQIKLIFSQLMRGLEYLHGLKIAHRDIKPRNLLLKATCDLKICDFGLSKICSDQRLRMTDYVCTRWYRAPEVLLGCAVHGPPVDIFSAGCILGELLCRRPLLPGSNSERQLQLTLTRFGKESLGFVPGGPIKAAFDRFYNTSTARGNLESYISCGDPRATGLIRQACRLNPDARISASQALRSTWFGKLTEVPPQIFCHKDLFSTLHQEEDINAMKELIRQEVLKVVPYNGEAVAPTQYSNFPCGD